MNERKRRRGYCLTIRQRKKLIAMVTEHPKLIACKVTEDFNYKDSQKIWEKIANECNSLPGARKTWRQWRKTWQDIRSNTKKRESIGEVPPFAFMLTPAEQEALGLKNVSSTTNFQEATEFCQEATEFVPLGQAAQDSSLDFNNEVESAAFFNEPDSPPEVKVFGTIKEQANATNKRDSKSDSQDSHMCNFNCDMLAASEQKKLQIKQDYLNFKKDYLKEKLKCIKEQTEALKVIARELSK